MLKLKTLFLVIIILCSGSENVIESLDTFDSKDYAYIGSFDGIKAYWKIKYNSYSRNYGVLYKLENTTSSCVTLKYRASFQCRSQKGEETDTGIVFIQRHAAKEGEIDNLYSYSYPCPNDVSPTQIHMQVEVKPK